MVRGGNDGGSNNLYERPYRNSGKRGGKAKGQERKSCTVRMIHEAYDTRCTRYTRMEEHNLARKPFVNEEHTLPLRQPDLNGILQMQTPLCELTQSKMPSVNEIRAQLFDGS